MSQRKRNLDLDLWEYEHLQLLVFRNKFKNLATREKFNTAINELEYNVERYHMTYEVAAKFGALLQKEMYDALLMEKLEL